MTRQNVLEIWTFVLLVIFGATCSATVFTEHPADVTVTEGDDATFRCGTELPCSFFYWGRYTVSTGEFSYVSKCLDSYERQYTIERTASVYSLRVRGITLEDSGTVYECWQYSGGSWLQSNNATLTVLQDRPTASPRPDSETVCLVVVEPPGFHSVGDRISLQCLSPRTPGKTSWNRGRQKSDLGSNGKIKPGQTPNAEWTLTELDNFREFTCSDESGIKCSVVPLAIPTNVTITSPRLQILEEGVDAVFKCTADAVPEVTSYRWLITKNGVTADLQKSHRFVFSEDESGATFNIHEVAVEDTNTEVMCEAWNELNITGRSLPSLVRVTRAALFPTATSRTITDQTKKQGKKSAKNPDQDGLTQWSHLTLVIGIMLCIVVLFVAVGLGLLYGKWKRRIDAAARGSAPSSPQPEDGAVFALHNLDDGNDDKGMRASAVQDDPNLDRPTISNVNENVYTESVYMEIGGNTFHPHEPAPAHMKAMENEPVYERHF